MGTLKTQLYRYCLPPGISGRVLTVNQTLCLKRPQRGQLDGQMILRTPLSKQPRERTGRRLRQYVGILPLYMGLVNFDPQELLSITSRPCSKNRANFFFPIGPDLLDQKFVTGVLFKVDLHDSPGMGRQKLLVWLIALW
jgi:hypothetical protein